jgi:hypothetical protein
VVVNCDRLCLGRLAQQADRADAKALLFRLSCVDWRADPDTLDDAWKPRERTGVA